MPPNASFIDQTRGGHDLRPLGPEELRERKKKEKEERERRKKEEEIVEGVLHPLVSAESFQGKLLEFFYFEVISL